MASSQMSEVVRHLRRAVSGAEEAGLSDGQLLEGFLRRRDPAALAALVRRHAPMVWGVCRRVLSNHHDAEDAFQATFLVLVRRAASIVPRERVGNWLHGVARQTALKARANAAKRTARERQLTRLPEPEAAQQAACSDLRADLDLELSKLPNRYRVVLVLCDLEGLTRKEASQRLGVPEGTVAGRLARARALLARRLAQHAAPAPLLSATIQAATSLAAGKAAVVSAGVASLTEGVVQAMWMKKLKIAAVLVVIGILGAGVGASGLLGGTQAAGGASGQKQPDGKPAQGGQLKQAEKRVWKLEFRFKNPRLIAVPDPHMGGKTILACYLWYQVVNPTGEPHTFVPDFEVVADGKVYHDGVWPSVTEAIRRREDPTGHSDLKDSVTVAGKPIPPSRKGAPKRAVTGVAVWTQPELSRAGRFTIYVSGLTSAWSVTQGPDGPILRRGVLQLRFERGGDPSLPKSEGLTLAGPAEWVDRQVELELLHKKLRALEEASREFRGDKAP